MIVFKSSSISEDNPMATPPESARTTINVPVGSKQKVEIRQPSAAVISPCTEELSLGTGHLAACMAKFLADLRPSAASPYQCSNVKSRPTRSDSCEEMLAASENSGHRLTATLTLSMISAGLRTEKR
jgi:hypothetical protein